MKKDNYVPDVVDFAYQVIAMQKENEWLRMELEHYKEIHEIHCKDLTRRDKHSSELTSIILSAVFDPESVINKGHAAILREQVGLKEE